MRKKTFCCAVLLILFGFVPKEAKADQAAGAELLYQWVSDSTYRVYWKFYRDCGGVDAYSSQDLCVKNRCNSFSATYSMYPVVGELPTGLMNGSEIQKMCPGIQTTCTAMNTLIPGYQEWWYTTLITLPFQCDYWEFSATVSSRNLSVTNLANRGNLWVDATLDNLHFQGDTSPYFSVKPVPYVCDNAPYIYNSGAVDINGDSLYFQLEYPSTSALCSDTLGDNLDTFNQSNIPGPGGFSLYSLVNNPVRCNNTFSLNHWNGQMSFVPSGSQTAVVNVLVSSYHKGILIGHVMRDIQFVVRECPNLQPEISVNLDSVLGGVDNYDSAMAPTVNYPYQADYPATYNGFFKYFNGITTCSGNTLTFTFQAASTDTSSILGMMDNHTSATPGATLIYAGYGTDTVTGSFSWMPTTLDTGVKVLTLIAYDSSCKHPGIIIPQTYTLMIRVNPATTAFFTDTIYNGDIVHLHASGGSNFTWTALLPAGSSDSSLSCTACNNPTAMPAVTTEYVVGSDLTGSCSNTDTFTIAVLPALNQITGSVAIGPHNGNPSNPVYKVWLMAHDTIANTVYAIDSTIDTGSTYQANYQFLNEPAGVYITKGALINGTTPGTGAAPSYDFTSIYWDSAKNILYSGIGGSFNNDIFLQPGIVTTGPGFVAGNITSGTNGVPNLLVFLKNTSDRLVFYTCTDADGNYSFNNLPLSYYTVYPEKENYRTIAVTDIQLTSGSPFQNGVNFIQDTLAKTITPVPLGVDNIMHDQSISVYPNPTTGIINISCIQYRDQEATITITDMLGRNIMTVHYNFNNSSGTMQFDLSSYNAGLYFINIDAGSINRRSLIVLKRET